MIPTVYGRFITIGTAALLTCVNVSAQDAARYFHPAVSPDGMRLAFTSDTGGNLDVYVMSVDGKNLKRITHSDSLDLLPAWSPDGQKIAFTSRRTGDFEIFVVDADGGEPENLTRSTGSDMAPSWSPDGARIAFSSTRDGQWRSTGSEADGPLEIYSMRADGSDQTRLTFDPSRDDHPSWSPDGERIAFSSRRFDGHWRLSVMSAEGRDARPIVEGESSTPNWSPDGRHLTFDTNRDGNWEVYVVRVDGTGARNLSNAPGRDSRSVWSPDGRSLFFVSDRDGGLNIYRMNIDESDVQRVTGQ